MSGLLDAITSEYGFPLNAPPAPLGWPSLSAVARSATWPKPLLSEANAPDTDGMSLFDYAGSRLGWHPDWPEARPSVWHELPALADLAPAPSLPEYGELHLSIFIPPMPVEHDMAAKAPHINYCGGCFQRFEAMNAVTAANALRHHIEAELCAHYAVPADQSAMLPPARCHWQMQAFSHVLCDSCLCYIGDISALRCQATKVVPSRDATHKLVGTV